MSSPLTDIRFDHSKRPDLDFDIVTLEDIFQRPNMSHDPTQSHRVHFYVMILVTEGEGQHTIDFKTYPYSKGSIVTIRKDQIHNFHQSDAKGYMLLFTEEYVLSYLESKSAQKINELFNELLFDQHTRLSKKELEEILVLVQHIQQEFNIPSDNHTSGIIRNFLQILTSKMHRIRSKSSHATLNHRYTTSFLQFQQLVEQNCQQNRSVNFYADKLNITSRTLNNITQSVAGKSAKKHVDDTLILQIKRLLINTELSIKEIAYQSGFDEPTNLFKYFKRFVHRTPQDFRSQYLKQ